MNENKNTAPSQSESAPQEADVQRALRNTLSIDAINELRGRQRDMYIKTRDTLLKTGFSAEEARSAALAAESKVNSDFIGSLITSDELDAQTGAIETLVQYYSYSAVPDSEWYSSELDEDGNQKGPSGMTNYLKDTDELIAAAVEHKNSTPADDTEVLPTTELTPEDTETIKEWRGELDELRDTLATLAAKRQGSVFGKGGETYKAAQDEYNKHIVELGKIENEALINDPDKTELEKNIAVISYLFAEQNKLREATTEKLKGTKVGKFVELMNRGNKWQRLGKGVLLGAGVGLAAAGIGAIAGVAGAAVVGAGVATATTGAWRFARGFATSDARNGRGVQSLNEKDVKTAENRIRVRSDVNKEVNVDTIQQYFSDKLEQDTKQEQHKRRKSVAWGLGGIALGGVAAYGIQAAIDSNVGGTWNDGHGFKSPEVGASPEPTIEPEGTPTPEPEVIPTPEIITPDPNFNVEVGEGGISLFQDLGLTEVQWYEVQTDLLNNFPGEFYQNPGESVRISKPGPLPLEVQQYIKTRFGLS